MVHDKSIQPEQFLHLIFSCEAFIHYNCSETVLIWNFAFVNLCPFFNTLFFQLCRIFRTPSPYRILQFPQWFSIGLRSGDSLGHWRTFIFFLLNHSRVKFAACLGSLSCWNVHLRLSNKRYAIEMPLLQYLTIHATFHLTINDVQCTSAMRGRTSPNHCTTTTVLHSWYAIFTAIRCPLRSPIMTCGIESEKFFFLFHQTEGQSPNTRFLSPNVAFYEIDSKCSAFFANTGLSWGVTGLLALPWSSLPIVRSLISVPEDSTSIVNSSESAFVYF